MVKKNEYWLHRRHMAIYEWLCGRVASFASSVIYDVGCNTGYGAQILASAIAIILWFLAAVIGGAIVCGWLCSIGFFTLINLTILGSTSYWAIGPTLTMGCGLLAAFGLMFEKEVII